MPQKAIIFFLKNVNYNIREKNKIRIWLERAIKIENKKLTEINYILCNDTFLLNLNKKFLKHNTLTDVISFDMAETDNSINGEIYISINRVKANASKYKVKIQDELHRVMIHGLLHLVGYNDFTVEEKEIMRKREDYYLSLR
ncbi:MAG: rRNA maturation RNase YbeY [Bacteroidales bacterium]|nr:rRNA maturation RNase YbeY [Bacteroidales bacterium]